MSSPDFLPLPVLPLEEPSSSRPVMDELKSLEPGSSVSRCLTVPAPGPGEQYRFHFDMTRCIGCRCCEVACNEQNNNPTGVHWRRVGELEGGSYPRVTRLHVSMACNHCLEPSCLEGCPVDAYTKLDNGIVDHSAEACIGCQYCTWNCPYGVPQFNPERRVVTKCNLCADRLGEGQLPACVNACPTEAIQIETVSVADWREKIQEANAPGVPPADLTLSTTRITLPEDLPEGFGQEGAQMLRPEAAHWSLVIFLVLSQWSVGLYALTPLLPFTGEGLLFSWTAGAWLLGLVSLHAALFHLGRPVHAIRAVKAWRHSWLSREVVAFSAYAAAGLAPPVLAFLDFPPAGALFRGSLILTVLFGALGIFSSVGIYRIPARPAWEGRSTLFQFFLTPLTLASATALVVATVASRGESLLPLALLMAISCGLQTTSCLPAVLRGLIDRESPLHGSAILMTRHFARQFWLRMGLLGLATILAALLPALEDGETRSLLALSAALTALLGEVVSRYLFFVTVVPRNVAGNYFSAPSAH